MTIILGASPTIDLNTTVFPSMTLLNEVDVSFTLDVYKDLMKLSNPMPVYLTPMTVDKGVSFPPDLFFFYFKDRSAPCRPRLHN